MTPNLIDIIPDSEIYTFDSEEMFDSWKEWVGVDNIYYRDKGDGSGKWLAGYDVLPFSDIGKWEYTHKLNTITQYDVLNILNKAMSDDTIDGYTMRVDSDNSTRWEIVYDNETLTVVINVQKPSQYHDIIETLNCIYDNNKVDYIMSGSVEDLGYLQPDDIIDIGNGMGYKYHTQYKGRYHNFNGKYHDIDISISVFNLNNNSSVADMVVPAGILYAMKDARVIRRKYSF